jgi:hypothetical protein
MTGDKAERHVIVASTMLLLIFVGLTCLVVSISLAKPVPDGADGSGSEVGKSLNVPDLRSPAVQKLSDAELAQVIATGKGGMPSFKTSLSQQQIHALVAHIRSLHSRNAA